MSLLTLAKPVKVEKKVSSNTGSENPAGGRGGAWDAIAPLKKMVCFCTSSGPRINFRKLPFFGSKHHQ